MNEDHYNEPPFETLYVSVLGGTKKIYKNIAQAKSYITSNVDKDTERFRSDCEIWTVGENGWELFFKAKEGNHSDKIHWRNNIESSKRRDERIAENAKRLEEENARKAYEELKKRFDG